MKRSILASLYVPIAFLFFISCAKIDTTTIGAGLLPDVDNINTFDTILSVITDNKLLIDSTRMPYGEFHALGIIDNDAEFGNTTAQVYSSFNPGTYKVYPFIKRDSVKIDSVVLSLAYVRSYGDSNSTEQFDVREIDPASSFADSYYLINSEEFATLNPVLGSQSVKFSSLKDSIVYKEGKDTIRTNNEIRIHIDTSFARRFIQYDTTTAYSGDSLFKLAFKGLSIRPNTSSASKNGLAYINLDDNDHTKLTFYCRVTNNGAVDTIAPTFTNTGDPQANLVKRSPQNNYLANLNNASPNDEKLYIQSTPGSYASVQIPGLSTLSNRVIHRAELIFEKYPSDQDFYEPPATLFVDAINASGDSSFTIRNDFIPTSSTASGYDAVTLGGVYRHNQYVFQLTRYVQSLITKGFPNRTLRVHAPFYTVPWYISENSDTVVSAVTKALFVNTPIATGRVVLYGGGSPEPKHARLRIIYSRI